MIGLKRGTVRLSPHSKAWKVSFERERQRLEKTLGASVLDIRHIGSTAIPGIHAKPIIDISLGLRNFKDAKKLAKPLSKIGYNFYRKFQRQILFAKGPDAKRTHYVHVMRYNGAKWKTDILFRDYLRTHPKRRGEYEKLKIALAAKYPNEREKYSAGKKTFISKTLDAAKSERK
jgi:GrpB-like predicted nucleotidyltransferase (UPF0157 family)